MKSFETIISGLIDSEPDIDLCVLYGSTATGNLAAHSDIDIAIAGKNAIPVERLVDLQIALSSDLEREVDLVDLSAIEGLILSEIFRKGKVLIKKDPSLYACYMRKVIYFNEDMLPNIRMILEKRASRFANGK